MVVKDLGSLGFLLSSEDWFNHHQSVSKDLPKNSFDLQKAAALGEQFEDDAGMWL